MEIEINEEISLLDQAKIQAQVLVPLLRALREEIGKERADALVGRALADWSRRMAFEVGARLAGTSRQRWDQMQTQMLRRVGSDVDLQPLAQDDERLDFDIRGCRYAELFKRLGEPELGAVLFCDIDFHMAEASQGAVELERTQTTMKGASCCDFRYRFKSESER